MITICTLIFLSALFLVSFAIRKVIYVSYKKHLFDEPSEKRKIHKTSIPNLGGVAIFAIMLFCSSIFLPYAPVEKINYMLASSVILFTLGLTDDLVGVNPLKKIWAQLLAALVVTIPGDIRFTGFYGFLGVQEIPYWASIVVSVAFFLLVVNAFNLIDGINCLAGSIALLACLFFAWSFYQLQQTGLFYLSVALAGCLAGFLFYNRTPAKIFMGDTGSLFLGCIISVFAIQFSELNKWEAGQGSPLFKSAPAIVFALLIIPIFDTLRVFAIRILNRRSPFHADRNHIHHRLIDLRLTHMQASAILLSTTICCLTIVTMTQYLSMEILLLITGLIALILNTTLSLLHIRRAARKQQISIPASHPEISARFAEKPVIQLVDKKDLKETLEEV